MLESTENGIRSYQFPNLLPFPELRHAVFARTGGFSSRPFRSLNVGLSVEDNPANVEKNREAISRHFDGRDLVFVRQVHGKGVRIFAQPEGMPDGTTPLEGDAAVSNLRSKMLAIQVADCQAVLLYDPVQAVVGNVHSGWRGSILNIIGETSGTMASRFSSVPRDILAGVSPSLGPCCAEFVNHRDEIPPRFRTYRTGGDLFDFWALSHDQLRGAGVREENINISRICTKCNTDRFFSYRGEGKTGRFVALIGLA